MQNDLNRSPPDHKSEVVTQAMCDGAMARTKFISSALFITVKMHTVCILPKMEPTMMVLSSYPIQHNWINISDLLHHRSALNMTGAHALVYQPLYFNSWAAA